MPVILFNIHTDGIDVGYVGDPIYQNTVKLSLETRNEVFTDDLKLQEVLLKALDTLLVTIHSITVVIIEPPLLTLHAKQAIADALLGKFRVAAIGFIQQSVCCVAGHKLSLGIIIDDSEKLAVPVYDFRELTPFIRSLDDLEQDEAVEQLIRKVPMDIRRPLRNNVLQCKRKETWMGASALLTRRSVWPLITREKHSNGMKVWDSLFHMR